MKIKFVLILASLMLVMGIGSLAIGAEKDLVGLWAFDEGTGNKVKDLSGNGNDGTISGAKWVDGKFGKALEFHGDGDQVAHVVTTGVRPIVPAAPEIFRNAGATQE